MLYSSLDDFAQRRNHWSNMVYDVTVYARILTSRATVDDACFKLEISYVGYSTLVKSY